MPQIKVKSAVKDSNRVVLFKKDKSAPKGTPIAREAYTNRADALKAINSLNAKVKAGKARILNAFVNGKWYYDVEAMEESDILAFGADDTIINYTE